MKASLAAKELYELTKELEAVSWDEIDPMSVTQKVKRKIDLINIISNQMREEEPTRDSFPEYGDAQGDLMEFVYERFSGMPIAAIIGFLEMAKMSIIDEA